MRNDILSRNKRTMGTLTLIQGVVLGSLIAAESIASCVYNLGLYEKRDTLISVVIAMVSATIVFSTTGFFLGVLTVLSSYGLFDIDVSWKSWAALLVLCDISYYAIHVLSHKVRFLWASHMIHHSSHKLNFTTNLRGPVVYLSFRMVFWTPMVLLGFAPTMIIVTDTVIQLYTVVCHSHTMGKWGPLEWIMNSPSHHRLHHACNPEYMDRNFGGMFIIWDRLFGTIVTAKEKPVYGLRETVGVKNPFALILLEWKGMFKDLRHTHSLRDVVRSIFGRPG